MNGFYRNRVDYALSQPRTRAPEARQHRKCRHASVRKTPPPTAFAYLLYFRLIAWAGATNAAAVTFVIPASAIAPGALVLGGQLEALKGTGFGVILIGLVVLDGRLLRRLAGGAGGP
jgi:hypothetical protein